MIEASATPTRPSTQTVSSSGNSVQAPSPRSIDRISAKPTPRALQLKEKLDQALGLVVWFNSTLKENHLRQSHAFLSGKVKNLKTEAQKEASAFAPSPSILSGKFSSDMNRVVLKTEICVKDILDVVELIHHPQASEEELAKGFDKISDLLVRSLADVNSTGAELARLKMPDAIGMHHQPVCPELQRVLIQAKEIKKLYISIPYENGMSSIKKERLIKYSLSRETGALKGYVHVQFFTASSKAGAVQNRTLDPSLKLPPLPERLDLSLLWNKRNGDKVEYRVNNLNHCNIYFWTAVDSVDLSKNILKTLVKEKISHLLLNQNAAQTDSSQSQDSPSAKREKFDDKDILDYFKSVCGEELIQEAQAQIELHNSLVDQCGPRSRPRSKSVELLRGRKDVIQQQS